MALTLERHPSTEIVRAGVENLIRLLPAGRTQ